jgi:hypothetical protein
MQFTEHRRIAVFFYGLFMDVELLRRKGVKAESPRRAVLRDYSLRIGRRASVSPDAGGRVFGMIMSLTQPEIETLYADESVRMYKPEAVLCELDDGSRTAALCFNLVERPAPADADPEYAAALRDAAERAGLPRDYIDDTAVLAVAKPAD